MEETFVVKGEKDIQEQYLRSLKMVYHILF